MSKADSKAAPADWERIELDCRAGVKTRRQISDENGITHGVINKRVKREGWGRDLSEKIQRKADDERRKAKPQLSFIDYTLWLASEWQETPHCGR